MYYKMYRLYENKCFNFDFNQINQKILNLQIKNIISHLINDNLSCLKMGR